MIHFSSLNNQEKKQTIQFNYTLCFYEWTRKSWWSSWWFIFFFWSSYSRHMIQKSFPVEIPSNNLLLVAEAPCTELWWSGSIKWYPWSSLRQFSAAYYTFRACSWSPSTIRLMQTAGVVTHFKYWLFRNFRALLIVSALSQQIMLLCQVAMFTYDLYIENLMPATESLVPKIPK